MARKLEQRNHLVRDPSDRIRIFLISSVEALEVDAAAYGAADVRALGSV